jgi:hypothetical protein
MHQVESASSIQHKGFYATKKYPSYYKPEYSIFLIDSKSVKFHKSKKRFFDD